MDRQDDHDASMVRMMVRLMKMTHVLRKRMMMRMIRMVRMMRG